MLKRHKRAAPSCAEDNFEWRYGHAKTAGGEYFCYFGCSTFKSVVELE